MIITLGSTLLKSLIVTMGGGRRLYETIRHNDYVRFYITNTALVTMGGRRL